MSEQNLATELLTEIKTSAKRWFIIAMVELLIILGLGVGILWYMTLPVEECSIEQEVGHNGYNLINTGEGDLYNGTTESDLQTQGNQK